MAAEALAQKQADRYAKLFALDAVTKEQNDQMQAALTEATANRRDMQEVWIRSTEGTPADELEDSRQSYLQAKATLGVVLSGSRPEDIAAAAARLREAQAALDELLAGSRPEDVAQAKFAAAAAEAQVQSLKINVDDLMVRAPYDGIVDNIPVSTGDLVNPDTPLLDGFPNREKVAVVTPVVKDAKRHTVPLGRINHAVRLRNADAHRLFHDDIFAQRHCRARIGAGSAANA